MGKLNSLIVSEVLPTSHLDEYDEVIAMMEMSVDETISLDSSAFQQYVLDNWTWKKNFIGSVTKYLG